MANVFDENYNIKLEFLLDFFDSEKYGNVKSAVDKKQNLIVCQDNQVYVTDNTRKLISQFKRDVWFLVSLAILQQWHDDSTKTWQRSLIILNRRKLKIKVAESYKARGVAFHHGIGKIIVWT